MKSYGILAISVLALLGCATYDAPQKPVNFRPVGKIKDKSPEEQQTAFRVAEAKCKAHGAQVAAGAPSPAFQQPNNVRIMTGPVYASGPAPLPRPYIPDASGMIAAQQAGEAVRFRNELELKSAMGCMAQEGWVLS